MSDHAEPVHFRNVRLFVNAGMAFPTCRAKDELLDTDEGRKPTTSDARYVTCPECLNILDERRKAHAESENHHA